VRLIGSVENEKQAFIFYSFLLQMGIHSTYEPYTDSSTKKEEIHLWVYEEEFVDQAISLLEEFKQSPSDPRFADIPLPFTPPQPPDLIAERYAEREKKQPQGAWHKTIRVQKQARKAAFAKPFTTAVIFLCALLFFFTFLEEKALLRQKGLLGTQLGSVPLEKELLFDYPPRMQALDDWIQKSDLKSFKALSDLPKSDQTELETIQQIPTWTGLVPFFLSKLKGKSNEADFHSPLFPKIRQGEFWRLFTPCLLHGGLLHILFNMSWAWLLLGQIEGRLKLWKLTLLILIIGVLSNVLQYLMSGPFFVGFSGIIVGLVGFIWMRQKLAPWEGYPLHPSTTLLILIFIAAMVGIDLISNLLFLFGVTDSMFQIANTAHIVGGLCGVLLGRLSFFARAPA